MESAEQSDRSKMEGRLLAMKIVIAELVATSGLDIEALHEEVTSKLSALIEIGDTPETTEVNGMFSSACHELDSTLLFARTRRAS